VGYRWFAKYRLRPRYAFGHGLSYTTFGYADLQVAGGDTVRATFTVTNAGRVAGAVVPQLYLTRAAGSARTRLLGFERVHLGPGESRRITITADPRLLATFDATAGRWRIADGTHEVALAAAADRPVLTAGATLTGREFGS
ncbi:MAG TPA: fibronectin type III-like domain-contianing protein, partial [Micromonosporaceae bacterium]|nr:fibronectin type III-like domain-contianing protein [Micromonosporaceae bacterium]